VLVSLGTAQIIGGDDMGQLRDVSDYIWSFVACKQETLASPNAARKRHGEASDRRSWSGRRFRFFAVL
jgi:hypothetical protein